MHKVVHKRLHKVVHEKLHEVLRKRIMPVVLVPTGALNHKA